MPRQKRRRQPKAVGKVFRSGVNASVYIDNDANVILKDLCARTDRSKSTVVSRLLMVFGPRAQEDITVLNPEK